MQCTPLFSVFSAACMPPSDGRSIHTHTHTYSQHSSACSARSLAHHGCSAAVSVSTTSRSVRACRFPRRRAKQCLILFSVTRHPNVKRSQIFLKSAIITLEPQVLTGFAKSFAIRSRQLDPISVVSTFVSRHSSHKWKLTRNLRVIFECTLTPVALTFF